MRKLYFVPILHMSADMGSLGSALDETGKAEFGQEAWQKHEKAVSSFWDSIARFFDALDVKGFKIYQDGMLANGVEGLRIIGEGISQGSKNYEIIGKLLERGAVLVKTEDPALLKQEYAYIAKIARSKLEKEKEAWAIRYKLAQSRLLTQRDNFIIRRIRETLDKGETGVIFIGAYHDILSRLPGDIQVTQVRDVAKIRQYHKTLATQMDNSW
ncbi:hypothetical protein LM599_06995 [Candidatus Acetothermia bacterium]|nr:hypothetical protein [Candidatus Acetothermia bacterium]